MTYAPFVRRLLLGVVLSFSAAAVPVVCLPESVEAQVRPQRQELEARIRQAFRNRVRQELQLTRDEVPALTEVWEWSEGERRSIAQRTRNLNDRATTDCGMHCRKPPVLPESAFSR